MEYRKEGFSDKTLEKMEEMANDIGGMKEGYVFLKNVAGKVREECNFLDIRTQAVPGKTSEVRQALAYGETLADMAEMLAEDLKAGCQLAVRAFEMLVDEGDTAIEYATSLTNTLKDMLDVYTPMADKRLGVVPETDAAKGLDKILEEMDKAFNGLYFR